MIYYYKQSLEVKKINFKFNDISVHVYLIAMVIFIGVYDTPVGVIEKLIFDLSGWAPWLLENTREIRN